MGHDGGWGGLQGRGGVLKMAIPVTVVGGYLGAGKTTLVNHILRSADERIAVLVNDFGDINIDEALIESADGDTISLANGCICCSMIDGFAAALGRVRSFEPAPNRVVIEASGVADPSKVTPFAYGPGFALDATVVVVDAERIEEQIRNEYIGDVVVQQLQSADLLILNKTDLVSDLRRVRDAVSRATTCAVVEVIEGRIDISLLFGYDTRISESSPPIAEDSAGIRADERFTSWAEVHDEPLDRAELASRLIALNDSVVRIKGIVRFSDTPAEQSVVQRVGERLRITSDGAWRGGQSQLVFIALRADE